MKEAFSSRSKTILCGTCIAVVFVTVGAWVPGKGPRQEPNKAFQKLDSYPNEPLNVINIKSADKKVALGEQFNGPDDWLKTAQLTVKNISGKDIVFVEIDLNFPETNVSGNEMSFPLRLGTRPGVTNSNPPVVLKNNNDATLSLEGKKYEQLVEFIEHRHSISAIGKVVVNVGFVIFADGTAWSAGIFYQRDSQNPNRYFPKPQ
jgi:hypothetical protein